MLTAAIITAAGAGRRMGGATPKQFLKIGNEPVIVRTVKRFDESRFVDLLVLVTEAAYIPELEGLLRGVRLKKEWKVVAGGKERQDSVANGLDAVPNDFDIVAVHDGVRPFIDTALIDLSIETARTDGACIVAIPVKDTIKRSADDGVISRTVDRSDLWSAQTPQTFRYDILRNAFDRAKRDGFYGTDEASLVERSGVKVRLIKGSDTNIKITTPDDLLIAEAICGSA